MGDGGGGGAEVEELGGYEVVLVKARGEDFGLELGEMVEGGGDGEEGEDLFFYGFVVGFGDWEVEKMGHERR